MPIRVHALLVVRPDGHTPADLHLKRTLAGLAAQTRAADALTIVVCGTDARVTALAGDSRADAVIAASPGMSYAHAIAAASARVDADSAVWLLAQDTAPEPDALAALVAALERSPSVAAVAPKLVRWEDRAQLVSLGSSMTRLGRAVELAEGQLDQGQHDGDEDVLGSDVRGLLVRADAWQSLGGVDPALAGADEGLDLGVRARLAGRRVCVAPDARVAVAGDGAAGLAAALDGRRIRRRAYASRIAQLHRRLAYASPIAMPFLWLAIVPLALWRSVVQLVAKTPGLVGPEWAAAVVAAVRWRAIVRSRRRLRSAKSVSWSLLAPLRVSQAQLRQRFDAADDELPLVEGRADDLRFFSGGGAWAVLGALAVSIASFTALLAWPVLGGGGLLPLRATVAELWADAAYGRRAYGLDVVGPADPFAGVVAALGSLWPFDPSNAVVAVWILALPLAVLGGWFAATRITSRAPLRIAAGVGWALAPTFLSALVSGRPAAVLLHLLLPWLFYVGVVVFRSWGAAGVASVLLVAVAACAPSLVPALVVLWVLAVVLAVVGHEARGLPRLIWVLVPSVAVFAPLALHQVRAGDPVALLADPGLPWQGSIVDADAAGRALLAAGFPTPDPGGWSALLSAWGSTSSVWWVPLLVAPLGILALLAPTTRRWVAGGVALAITAAGLATAFVVVGLGLGFSQSQVVTVWPGSALSLAWLGALAAALLTIDVGFALRPRFVRPAAIAVVVISLTVLAFPALTAFARGQTVLTDGPRSTLPAYIAAQGRSDTDVRTLVLTPQNAGGIAAQLVSGGSDSLGGQATIISTRTTPTTADGKVAIVSADLITAATTDSAAALADLGVQFVLLAPAVAPESDRARAVRLRADTSIDQSEGLVKVGVTARGVLWRVQPEPARPAPPTAAQLATARAVDLLQLGALGIALLLAVPTPASLRASRRLPRIVGDRSEVGS